MHPERPLPPAVLPPPRRSRAERRALVALFATLAVVVVGLTAWAVVARFVLHGPVTAASLAVSVREHVPYERGKVYDRAACAANGRARTWDCQPFETYSGDARWRVVVEPGESCWTARALRYDGKPMSERAAGCVHRWQW